MHGRLLPLALAVVLLGLGSAGCRMFWDPVREELEPHLPAAPYPTEVQVVYASYPAMYKARLPDVSREIARVATIRTYEERTAPDALRANLKILYDASEAQKMGPIVFAMVTGISIYDSHMSLELELLDRDRIVARDSMKLEGHIRGYAPGLILFGIFAAFPAIGRHEDELIPMWGLCFGRMLADALKAHPELQARGRAGPPRPPSRQPTAEPSPEPVRAPASPPDPAPVVAVASPQDGFTTGEAEIQLLASVAHPAGLREVLVFVNDAPLADGGARGVGGVARAPGRREHAIDLVVPLGVGENRIRLVARSASGRAVEVVRTVRREAAVGAGARGKWAVVVGVSRYKNSGAGFANLRYAAADAGELAAVLTTGCGFDPARVRLLVDEEATSTALRDALFGFLGQAIEEDLVVIYFAGHGVPEPTNPKNLYLLTHDADPARLAATAFPMWDVETALRRSVKAERVLVLADACHSAGVAGDVGTRGAGDNAVNRYLAKLEEAGPGRAIFTASEAGELSQEDARWGGGHGVFTWHVVQALRGAADRDRDGIVTLGEMLDHVDEAVRRDTGSAQHPARGGRYDRRLPLAVVAR